MKNIINLTPHVVRLNNGTEFPPSGQVARVSASYAESSGLWDAEQKAAIPAFKVAFGEITGLPPAVPICSYCGTTNCGMLSGSSICEWEKEPEYPDTYIVSGLVASACSGRLNVVSPATGHPDAVRKEGQIYSVPGFIRA